MFALKPRKEIAIRIVLSVVILFNAFSSTAVFAKSPSTQDPVPSPTLSATVTETPTAEPTNSQKASPMPAVTETATLSPSPIATKTPIPSVSSTPTASVGSKTPILSLSSDPGFVTPGGSLILSWAIEGVSLIEYQVVLQITLPEGISLIDSNVGEYDPTSRVLIIPVTVSS